MLTIAVFACIFIILIYYNLTKRNGYWKAKQIKHLKPLPFFGNMAQYFFRKQPLTEIVQEIYWKYPNERYLGFYVFLQPVLMIRDPDLIKQITVKEFDSFPEHQPFIPEGIDPLWDKNLFAMKGGQKWHDTRSILSPSFTSSKMRLMFPSMLIRANKFIQQFLEQNNTVTVEMNDIFGRLISDLIATTSLGVTCDEINAQENQFCFMGEQVNDTGGIKGMLNFFYSISPIVMMLFNITMRKKTVTKFFKDIVNDAIQFREQNEIIRPDMVHLMLEARKTRSITKLDEKNTKRVNLEITDDDITAQVLDFFAAGVETTSNLLAYAAYELTLNPDVQERLLDEVSQTMESHDDDMVSYESLLGMKYLDMIVSETLRKWPPSEVTDRLCVRSFTIPPKSCTENELRVDPNTICWIPTYALQRDPKYYPDPDKFDPERFSDANKHKLNPFTYLPFGIGPRSCIGMRFALLMAKLALFVVVKHFELVAVEETQIPLVLSKGNFNMATENGIWLGLKRRTGIL